MTGSKSGSDALGEPDRGARLRVGALSLAAALLTALALLAAGGVLRQPLFDAFHRYSPAPASSPRIQIVVVDAESLTALGGWPWSRYTLARLTEQIAAKGAVAIGYDFLFAEADSQNPAQFAERYPELSSAARAEVAALPSADAIFAKVIGRTPVVLARAGVDTGSYDQDNSATASNAPPVLPPEVTFEGPVPGAIPSYTGVVANVPLLDGSAIGHGLANGPPDADGVVRRVPLLGRAAGVLTPSLALELVRVAEGADTIRLQGTKAGLTAIRVGTRRIAVDAGGRIELRLAVTPANAESRAQGLSERERRAYRTLPAVNLLRKGVRSEIFKNSIVLVGLTATGTSDVVTTPRDTETYGVFVQAQAVDAILRGGALQRPAWAPIVEWSLGLALVLLAWVGVPRASMPLVGLAAVLETAAAFGGSWLAFQNNLLIDPYPMLVPGAATSAVMFTLLFVEGRRMQSRLRTALQEERLTAERISTELSVAADIQSGMLAPRHVLAQVSEVVELDAVLQPARSVGGDLYDAFRFDDGRVCFLVGDVTGKGVPASLFMALSKALSRSFLVRPDTSLEAAMRGINLELSRDNGQAMAVSLLVGVLHADGTLHLCSAGHENPLVVDVAGQVREIMLRGGPPLCVVDDFPYAVEIHRLALGETLFAFTDGLTEAQSPDGILFSREQVLDAITLASQRPTISEMVDQLIAAVRTFEAGGEPSDDLTVMALRLRTKV